MKKLTKEQAGWLEEIMMAYIRYKPGIIGIERYFTAEDIAQALNKCTEKEFPSFKISLLDSSQVTIDQDQIQRSLLYINVVNEYGYFNKEEFKQFTEGCIAITKWIEENE